MATEGGGSSHELKRKDATHDNNDIDDAELPEYKKAKYSWQIKGSSLSKDRINGQHADGDITTELNTNHVKSITSATIGEKQDERSDDNSSTPVTQTDKTSAFTDQAKAPNEREPLLNNDSINNLDSAGSESILRDLNSKSITHNAPSGTANNASSFNSGYCVRCKIGRCDLHRTPDEIAREVLRKTRIDLYLSRRQNQHVAKAVVDNAINRTLEEMGVSPEQDPDGFGAEKNHVEDEGISQAILTQGLIQQEPSSSSQNVTGSSVTSTQVLPFSFTQSSRSLPCVTNVLQQNVSDCDSNDRPITSPSQDTVQDIPCSLDILDHAVSMAISSKGLKCQSDT